MNDRRLQENIIQLAGLRRKIAAETGIPYHRLRYFADSGSLPNAGDRELLKKWVGIYLRAEKRRKESLNQFRAQLLAN